MNNAMKKMLALLLALVMVLLASPFAVLAEGEIAEPTETVVQESGDGLIEENLTPVEPETEEPAETTPVVNVSNTVTAVNLLASGDAVVETEPTYLEQIAALQAEAEALDPASETLQADCADIYARLMAVYEPAAAEYHAGTMTEEEYNEIYNAVGVVMGILNGYGYDPYAVEQPAANDSIWNTHRNRSVIVALRTDGTIPGEPAVQGEDGYIYFSGRYSGQKDSYQIFANSATGIVDSSIVNHEHFNTDNPNTSMGLALSSGTNPATMVSGVNFETALLNAAKANYASSVIINGTDGMTLAQAYAAYGDNITQYYEIFPYVVKIENNYGYWMWHIDCAIRPKANVTLTYNINVPSGMTYPSSITVPNSESAPPPADFTIGSVGGLTNNKMTVEDSSGGEYEFTFLGWNTKADGSGDWYYPAGEITDVMVDTILYAIWDSNPAIGTGNFRIAKEIVAPDGESIDVDQSFTFTVAIYNADGTAATGTYSYTMYGANGVAISGGAGTIQNGGTLSLRHDQYVLIEDLPAVNDDDSSYKNVTVTETNIPDGYTPSWEGTAGDSTSVKIEGGRTSDVTCTNTKAVQTTSVTAQKVWHGPTTVTHPANATLVLMENGVKSTVADAEATVNADNSWSYTWQNLPINDTDGNPITYTVKEVAVPGYTTEITGDAATGFTVTNTYNPSVTVEKQVTGNMGDHSKAFTFTYNVGGTETSNTLAHSGKHTLEDIPVGTTVIITENPDGYELKTISVATVSGAAVTTTEVDNGVTFTMPTEDVTVTFTNDKTADVDTGILLDSLPYVVILAVVGAALVLWFVRKRRVDD